MALAIHTQEQFSTQLSEFIEFDSSYYSAQNLVYNTPHTEHPINSYMPHHNYAIFQRSNTTYHPSYRDKAIHSRWTRLHSQIIAKSSSHDRIAESVCYQFVNQFELIDELFPKLKARFMVEVAILRQKLQIAIDGRLMKPLCLCLLLEIWRSVRSQHSLSEICTKLALSFNQYCTMRKAIHQIFPGYCATVDTEATNMNILTKIARQCPMNPQITDAVMTLLMKNARRFGSKPSVCVAVALLWVGRKIKPKITLTAAQIAEILQISASTISRNFNRLIKKEVIRS